MNRETLFIYLIERNCFFKYHRLRGNTVARLNEKATPSA